MGKKDIPGVEKNVEEQQPILVVVWGDTFSDCSTRKGIISGNTYLLNLLRKGVGYEAKPLDPLSSVLTYLWAFLCGFLICGGRD